jgi:hypothetical protein
VDDARIEDFGRPAVSARALPAVGSAPLSSFVQDENGMPRFLRRLAEGWFEETYVVARRIWRDGNVRLGH